LPHLVDVGTLLVGLTPDSFILIIIIIIIMTYLQCADIQIKSGHRVKKKSKSKIAETVN